MEKENQPKKIRWSKRRGAKQVIIGAVMAGLVLLMVLMSLFGTPYDPNIGDLYSRGQPPSLQHPFGTDSLGRDVLSRTMVGGQVSISIAGMALIGTTLLGILCGLLSGFFGGATDAVLNMVAEIRQSMPMMLIIVVFLAVFGSSVVTMALILAIAEWVTIFRTVRARTIMEKKQDYVTAARANGASNGRILFRYIMPNVLPSVIVLSTLMIGAIVLQESSLSYVGIGVTRPYPSWGLMISDGQANFMDGQWWNAVFPALTLAMLVLGINILGDGLRRMWKME